MSSPAVECLHRTFAEAKRSMKRPAAAWVAMTGSLVLVALTIPSPLFAQAPNPAATVLDDPSDIAEALRTGGVPVGQRVVRNRRMQDAVVALLKLEAAQRWVEAVRIAQLVLDPSVDSFVEVPRRRELVGARVWVEEWIAARPPMLDAYRDAMEAKARRALDDAVRTGSRKSLIHVARQYGLTASGNRALAMLSVRTADAGDYDTAIALARRVVDRNALEGGETDESTDMRSAVEWMEQSIPSVDSATEQPASSKASSRNAVRLAAERLRRRQQWSGPGGTTNQSAGARGTSPAPRAAWSIPWNDVASGSGANVAWPRWLQKERDEDRLGAFAFWPTSVNGLVAVRCPASIAVIDAAEGRVLWRYPTRSSLAVWPGFESAMSTEGYRVRETTDSPQTDWTRASLLGGMSTDGQRLFFVDGPRAEIIVDQANMNGLARQHEEMLRLVGPSRLIALPFLAKPALSPPAPLWSIGGDDDARSSVWKDHRFCGAPVATSTWAYVVTEQNLERWISAIDPATGDQLWTCPVGTLDSSRRRLKHDVVGNWPALSQGILVVQTDEGVLAGVDAATGSLRWGVSAWEPDEGSRVSGRTIGADRQPAGTAFGETPVIVDQRVICLNPQSRSIRCFDLVTGRLQWTRPANGRAGQAVVLSAPGRVVVAQHRGLTALDANTGAIAWEAPDVMLAGRPVVLDGHIGVFPQIDNRLLYLNLKTGSIGGFGFLPIEAPLGNLAPAGDHFVSLSMAGVVGLPRASLLRQSLDDDTLDAATRTRLHVELSLLNGDLTEASRELMAVAASGNANVPFAQSQPESPLNGLLRETLFEQLARMPDRVTHAELAKLDQLCRSVTQRGRYLIHRAQRSWEAGAQPESVDALASLLIHPDRQLHAAPGESGWQVAPHTWGRRLLAQTSERDAALLRESLAKTASRMDSHDVAADLAVLLLLDDDERSLGRHRLARAALEAGRFHLAEQLFLQNWRDSDRRTAASAMAGLCETWDRAGFSDDAATLASELESQYGESRLIDGEDAAAFLSDWGRSSLAGAIWRRRRWSTPTPVVAAEIQQRSRAPVVAEEKDAIDRKVLASFRPLTGQLYSPNDGDRALVARDLEGHLLGRIALGRSIELGGVPASSLVGHFAPLAHNGRIDAVSLLALANEAPVWSLGPDSIGGRSASLFAGPAENGVSLFHTPSAVLAVRTVDGLPLWRRAAPAPGDMTAVDAAARLLMANGRVHVLAADRKSYLHFDAETGASLGASALESPVPAAPCWTSGASFIHLTAFVAPGAAQDRRWKGIDASTGQVWLDAPAPKTNNLIDPMEGDPRVFALVLADGSVEAWNAAERRRLWSLPLVERVFVIRQIQAVSCDGRHYVSLQKFTPNSQNLADGSLPATVAAMQDYVCCVDASAGAIKWHHLAFPRRLALFPWGSRLPFFLTVGRSSQNVMGNNHHFTQIRLLAVSVIDAETGRSLGTATNLKDDEFTGIDVDGEHRRVTLLGRATNVTIQLQLRPDDDHVAQAPTRP